MKAIRITAPNRIDLVEAPVPAPKEGQVLVKAERLSICGSDMRPLRRVAAEEAYPMPIGAPCHECFGVVVESRSPTVRVGQRGIVFPVASQGGSEYFVADAAV